MELDNDNVVEEMLQNLSLSDKIIFRIETSTSEPLNSSDKYNIAKSLLDKSPALFLEKYHKYLKYEIHAVIFENLKTDDPAVAFYLEKLKNFGNHINIKNRRFKKLNNLILEGKYFSHEQMKNREPLLYSRYIGDVLSSKEQEEKLDRTYDSFSGFLMNNLLFREDRIRRNESIHEEKLLEKFDQVRLKEDSDSSEDEVSDEDYENFKNNTRDKDDKRFLEDEFLELMKCKFLNGEDDYNYSDVDNDSTLDDLEEITRDMEEKYFDEEEEEEEAVDVNRMELCETNNENKNGNVEDDEDNFIEYSARDKLKNYLNK